MSDQTFEARRDREIQEAQPHVKVEGDDLGATELLLSEMRNLRRLRSIRDQAIGVLSHCLLS